MKKLLLALAIALLPSLASAQCNGVFSSNAICGRGSAEAAGTPHQVPAGSFAFGLIVGTTTISGGNAGRVLFDNAGILGEYTITGTAGSVVMSASPTLTGTANVATLAASVGLSLTLNQNVSTNIGVTNTTNAAGSLAGFLATSDTAVGQFGVAATTYSTALFAGRTFVLGASSGVLIVTNVANPIVFAISGAEVGRWDSVVPGKLIHGIAGTTVGRSCFANATSGEICLLPVTGALGTIAINIPAAAGTLAVSATSPITLSAAGVVACATCATSSGGGAATGTAPIAVSAAGVVSINAPYVTLTASNGGIVYSGAANLAILSGTATANLPLLSGSSTTPSWAAVSYPASATSGGVACFTSTTVMASSGLLAASGLMIGGGAGVCPSTTTTGSGVVTALGIATGSTGAFSVIIAQGTIALATGAIASGACTSAQTSSATGTATTDVIDAVFNADPTAVTGYTAPNMLTIIPYPTSNTVNFKVCNNTVGSLTPGAITLNWKVRR